EIRNAKCEMRKCQARNYSNFRSADSESNPVFRISNFAFRIPSGFPHFAFRISHFLHVFRISHFEFRISLPAQFTQPIADLKIEFLTPAFVAIVLPDGPPLARLELCGRQPGMRLPIARGENNRENNSPTLRPFTEQFLYFHVGDKARVEERLAYQDKRNVGPLEFLPYPYLPDLSGIDFSIVPKPEALVLQSPK